MLSTSGRHEEGVLDHLGRHDRGMEELRHGAAAAAAGGHALLWLVDGTRRSIMLLFPSLRKPAGHG